ncbi:MAG: hypothetical protein MJ114_01075 [Acetatifactor sp.]|nr:hypothetical protein [Acetatifactor sp.]
MIKILKKADRILLEMYTGMIVYGIVFHVSGAFFTKDQLRFAASLWFGILFGMAGVFHMARTLDKALPDPASAQKIIVSGYVVRYFFVAAVLALTAITGVLDTVIVFFAYMSVKVTAYLQPLTHKCYNKLFHETDPVGTPLPEDAEGEVTEETDESSDETASDGEDL